MPPSEPQNPLQVLLSFRYYCEHSPRFQCTQISTSGVTKKEVIFLHMILWTFNNGNLLTNLS